MRTAAAGLLLIVLAVGCDKKESQDSGEDTSSATRGESVSQGGVTISITKARLEKLPYKEGGQDFTSTEDYLEVFVCVTNHSKTRRSP